MKNLIVTIVFIFVFFSQLLAQKNEEWTTTKKPLLFEKLYLHVDREIYAQGDSIWMKVYHVNGISHQLNTNYRNIFVQLVAENGQVADQVMLFSINGQAQGMFRADTLDAGMYTIRAYTKYLEKFGEQALFHKKIWITEMTSPLVKPEKNVTDYSNMEVAFLPEGGNMVLNAANTLAFKAIDQKGKGVEVSGKIIDEKGDTILSFKSTCMGMGKLIFMPVDGSSYYAVIDQNPGMKVKLPEAMADGVHLNCRDNGESFRFIFSSNMKQQASRSFYFNVSHKGTVASRKIEMQESTHTLTLGKDLFPEGISKITLLDTLMNPFAERLIYVSKENDDLVLLRLDKNKYKQREKITINALAMLEENDSITSPLSVTVVNQNYFGAEGSTQNIKSYLLLDSELKGGIDCPASYFVDDKMPSAQKLDLLMMVNGWRTYLWDDVQAAKNANIDDWNDGGIEIKGFVKKLLWKAPLADVSLELRCVYKNYSFGKTTTNSNGRFDFGRVFFSDSTEVMINGLTKEGKRNLEIIPDPQFTLDTLVTPDLLKNTSSDISFNMNYYHDNATRQQKELAFNPEKGTIMLKGVDIMANRETAFTRSFGEYLSADKTLIYKKGDYEYINLVDYLEAKIPSLFPTGIWFTLRNRPVKITIDNLDAEYSELLLLRPKDILLIDVLDPGYSALSPEGMNVFSPSGLIAIYKKNPQSVPIDYFYKKGRVRPALIGFQEPVSFYSPSYTPEYISNPRPDYRPTLLWNPELRFENGKADIDFYTSDQLASYVVFVEGITKGGKICFATASFTVDKIGNETSQR